jgi:hypothetical protein
MNHQCTHNGHKKRRNTIQNVVRSIACSEKERERVSGKRRNRDVFHSALTLN